MRSIALDMIGFRSGKLVVTGRAASVGRRAYWLCACDCGGTTTVMGKYLRRHEVKSCGCLGRQPLNGKPIIHGHARDWKSSHGSLTYRSWVGMRQRCLNPHRQFAEYGGRGITVCERWLTFANFLADMGERPPGLSIDRIDNDGNYEPSNCRWATPLEQGNNSRQNRWLTCRGRTQTLTAWARDLGISPGALCARLDAALTRKRKKVSNG
jgi:hypothetical protein